MRRIAHMSEWQASARQGRTEKNAPSVTVIPIPEMIGGRGDRHVVGGFVRDKDLATVRGHRHKNASGDGRRLYLLCSEKRLPISGMSNANGSLVAAIGPS